MFAAVINGAPWREVVEQELVLPRGAYGSEFYLRGLSAFQSHCLRGACNGLVSASRAMLPRRGTTERLFSAALRYLFLWTKVGFPKVSPVHSWIFFLNRKYSGSVTSPLDELLRLPRKK